VPLYPWVPLVFALAMAWIVVSALLTTPAESIAAVVLILLGLPLYPLFRRRRRRPAASAAVTAPTTATPAPRA
jgi:TRAP-type mannitol/chloroaromatic compound transport system permease large subunit